MAYTIPSDTHIAGDSGHTTDHNNIADMVKLAAVTSGINVLNTAYSGGADPTGIADSAAAFTAAIAALPAGGGVIVVPPGSYKLASGITFHQGQGMICPGGSSCTSLFYTGSGTAITLSNSVTFTGGQFAGKFAGFYLDGYGAGASAVGIQISDLQGWDLSDAAIYGFQGKGIFFTTGSGWCEESTVRCRVVQCGTYATANSGAVVFNGTSFDYGNYDFTIVTLAGTHGVLLYGGAQLRGANLRIRGNFYTRATANTGTVIGLSIAGADDSYITDTHFDVAVEVAGTAGQIAHTSVLIGGNTASTQLTGSGVLSFNPFGGVNVFFQGFSNTNFRPFGFSGYIQDGTAAGPPYSGDGITIQGGVAYSINGHLNSRLGGANTAFFQFGPICEGQLTNGNNTLIFSGAGSGSYLRSVELWLAQPSSGAAGTVTWPAGTKWPGGTAPTLSSVNGRVDKLKFTFLAEGNWYGELVNTNYA